MNYPATSVVIDVPSNETLASTLEDMKRSIWWNHESHFLLVNENSDNGCQMAHVLLSTIWSFNVLSAVYLCTNSNHQIMLYSFSPYTSVVPTFWNATQSDNSSNNHWTLLEHLLEQPYELSLVSRKYIIM